MSRLYIVTCLFNFYAEYIMRNAGLAEAQARIQIAGRNINNLSYAESEQQGFRFDSDSIALCQSSDALKNCLTFP